MMQPELVEARISFWRRRSKEDREMLRQRWKALFDAEWSMGALREHDRELADNLHDQENLFVEACVTGILQDIEVHGSALCRGYLVATQSIMGRRINGSQKEAQGRLADAWSADDRGF